RRLPRPPPLSLRDALPIFRRTAAVPPRSCRLRRRPRAPLQDRAGGRVVIDDLAAQAKNAFIRVDAPERVDRTHRALGLAQPAFRSEEHTSELQSRENLVCR